MNSEKEAKIINILNKAEQIRNNNKSILDAKLGKIKSGYIICIGGSFVGMIIGIIWGSSGGVFAAMIYGVLCAAIGGSFKTFLERAVLVLPDCFVHTGNFVASFIIGIIKGIIKKIDTIIDDDNKSVKLIRDYLEYSRCVSDEKHTVLKELVTDGGKLHDNSFAKLIIEYDVNYAVNELNHRLDLLEKNQDVVREI